MPEQAPDPLIEDIESGGAYHTDPAACYYLDGKPNKDWLDLANCASVGGDEFFPDKGGTTRSAKLVCAACVVRADCVDSILSDTTKVRRYGVWGGLSERDRRVVEKSDPEAAQSYIARVHADADKRLSRKRVA